MRDNATSSPRPIQNFGDMPESKQTNSTSTHIEIIFLLAFSIASLIVDIIFVIVSSSSWRGQDVMGPYLFSMLASRIINVILCRYYVCVFYINADTIRKTSFIIMSALSIRLSKHISNVKETPESVGALCLFLDESYIGNIDKAYLSLSTFEFIYIILADLPQMVISIVGITVGSSMTGISIICLIFKISSIGFYILSFFKSASFKPIAKALLTRLSE